MQLGPVNVWLASLKPGKSGHILPGFARTLARAIKERDPLFSKPIYVTTNLIRFGNYQVQNPELAGKILEAGVSGITFNQAPSEDDLKNFIEKLFKLILDGEGRKVIEFLHDRTYVRNFTLSNTVRVSKTEEPQMVSLNDLQARIKAVCRSKENFSVYLSQAEVAEVETVLKTHDTVKLFVLPRRRAMVQSLCERLERGRIDLFTEEPISQYEPGYALKRVICRIVDGRNLPFPSSIQGAVAEKMFGIKVERRPQVDPKRFILLGIENQEQRNDLEQRLLRRIKENDFDAASGKLNIETRRKMLRSVQDHSPAQRPMIEQAIEELERILAGIN